MSNSYFKINILVLVVEFLIYVVLKIKLIKTFINELILNERKERHIFPQTAY